MTSHWPRLCCRPLGRDLLDYPPQAPTEVQTNISLNSIVFSAVYHHSPSEYEFVCRNVTNPFCLRNMRKFRTKIVLPSFCDIFIAIYGNIGLIWSVLTRFQCAITSATESLSKSSSTDRRMIQVAIRCSYSSSVNVFKGAQFKGALSLKFKIVFKSWKTLQSQEIQNNFLQNYSANFLKLQLSVFGCGWLGWKWIATPS